VAAKLTEIRIGHDGDPLPPGAYALARADGAIVGYKVRWREDDGVRRNAAKRFSVRKLGSLERARAEATAYRQAANEIAGRGELVLRPDSAARMTVGDLFKEWITEHAALNLSERYATDAVRCHGMDLHNLAAWAGHDVQTLQRRYSHIIARYRGAKPIDLAREFARARAQVEKQPFTPAEEVVGPQRAAQRRRRARRARAVPARP